MPDWRRHAVRAHGLLVFNGLLSASPLAELVALVEALAAGAAPAALQRYGALFRAIVEARAPGKGTLLTASTVEALAFDENALNRGAGASPDAVRTAAVSDLRTVQSLLRTAPLLPQAVAELAGLDAAPPWVDLTPPGPGPLRSAQSPASPIGEGSVTVRFRGAEAEVGDAGCATDPWSSVQSLAARVAQAQDWGELVDQLAAHYAAHGSGVFARHRAFRWADGALLPVEAPDVPPPATLVGYVHERALLRANTAQFLAGYRANNVLLYGDRGTGKSSSVKSLLWDCQGDWGRLRLVEVPKAHLAEFPAVVAQLRDRPQRFVLFVDDLSFEEGETEYKAMKAVLEGSLEARPDNVVVYATSNRRHLVREQFADRAAPGSTDVHAWDTVQEKLSFADRFGIAITFPTPDQAAYLAIVEGLAAQRGLAIEPAALCARAIEWAAWHNGRSGRAARQLVDFLEGELGLLGLPGRAHTQSQRT